jgi:peptidyl-tRNA hydrolase, PTH1 family
MSAHPAGAPGEDTVRILVGLGNPGPDYARTRHNIGFRTLDAFAARHELVFDPVTDTCAVAEGRIAALDVALVKPLFFMNRSGDSLLRWIHRRGWSFDGEAVDGLAAPLIVCDDIALPLGAARLRARGGTGGHNGLASLVSALASEDFPRLRLGVAAGEDPVPTEDWADYVLGEFGADEWAQTEDLIGHACDTLDCVLAEGIEAAASRFNRKAPSSTSE